jgi:Ca2+-binding RTX toxin-like protein
MLVVPNRVLTALAVTSAAVVATAGIAQPALGAATGAAKVAGTTVVFAAAAGASNVVLITRSGRTITIDDRVSIKAGTGCKAVKGDKTKVKCTTTNVPKLIIAALGDRNDDLSNNTGVAATVTGGAGNDRLFGGTAGDRLSGNAGNDMLRGVEGNDTLIGGAGGDDMHGGAGTDLATYADHTAPVVADFDYFTGDGVRREDRIGDVEHIIGGSGNDHLTGNWLANTLDGGGGNDRLLGGLGADVIRGGPGVDTVDYSDRDERGDHLRADLDGAARDDGRPGEQDSLGADLENIIGGSGDDVLGGNNAANRIEGWYGNDSLVGGAGNDHLSAGFGDDTLTGGPGADTMWGEEGTDTVSYADHSAPVIVDLDGHEGATRDDGQAGEQDTNTEIENIIGGTGDDILTGNGGLSTVDGGAGNDTITGSIPAAEGSRYGYNELKGGAGDDKIIGGGAHNRIDGGAGNDTIDGGGGYDIIDGGAGDDVLTGGDAEDVLRGGDGDDSLQDNADNLDSDDLDGGANASAFPGDTCRINQRDKQKNCETLSTLSAGVSATP